MTLFSRSVLALATLASFGLASAAHPASAQDLKFTLDNVKFSDGATATGYFDFNPSDQTFGVYNLTTTNGITDNLLGTHYTGSTRPNSFFTNGVNDVFVIEGGGPFPISTLVLDTTTVVNGPGTYSLLPGQDLNVNQGFSDSGELTAANQGRLISGGNLVVTPAAVPEASSIVSLGLLLGLGGSGLALAARRRKVKA